VEFLKPIANRVVDIRSGKVKFYEGDIEYYLYKRNAETEQLSPSRKMTEKIEQQSETSSRKEQKRIEAEQRNKKYALTKDLKKKISDLEKKIAALEIKEKELESLLLDPSIYGDHQKIMDLNGEYQKVKQSLTAKVKEWEEVSLSLEKIEREFD
jgi:ATP-binding cassette subfamily F protein 3